MLLDPFTGAHAIAGFPSRILSAQEAYAERLRAALTQPEPAARAFFDMNDAIASGRINVNDWSHIDLLRTKLSVPGIGPTDVSPVDERAGRRDARTRREEHGET